jgi:hypothetical protein
MQQAHRLRPSRNSPATLRIAAQAADVVRSPTTTPELAGL